MDLCIVYLHRLPQFLDVGKFAALNTMLCNASLPTPGDESPTLEP